MKNIGNLSFYENDENITDEDLIYVENFINVKNKYADKIMFRIEGNLVTIYSNDFSVIEICQKTLKTSNIISVYVTPKTLIRKNVTVPFYRFYLKQGVLNKTDYVNLMSFLKNKSTIEAGIFNYSPSLDKIGTLGYGTKIWIHGTHFISMTDESLYTYFILMMPNIKGKLFKVESVANKHKYTIDSTTECINGENCTGHDSNQV